MIRPLLLLLISGSLALHAQTGPTTEILWDEWGVPHIYAQNEEELFFAMGWAQMHNHANLIARLYGQSRGRAAEYWGEEYLENDQIVHTLRLPRLAANWSSAQMPEQQALIRAYVDGLNAYAQAHPEAIDEPLRIVLPLQPEDLHAHAAFVVYTRFVGGRDLGMVQRWSDKGSNTYAIAPARSASGHAMLVQNPHLPWGDEFLFHEAHAVAPGINSYGVTLVGFPGIAIGFNEQLGWSHTDNTIDNADTYELELKEGGYLLDGAVQAFEEDRVMLKVRQEDGSLLEQPLPLLATRHGPVVRLDGEKALAIRLPGYDTPNFFLQWWRMATAGNFGEFEKALQMGQIPFWNVMYADRAGDIFYLFNGQVPVRENGDWSYWNRIIPGGKGEDIWTDIHPYADLPKAKNPASGWLQNANDPPWYCTFPRVLDPADFPSYMAPRGMSFRPQRSVRMLAEDESITFDELVSYKLSTRSELADRLLDDLGKAVRSTGSDLAIQALAVLENWDRRMDTGSRGALLFYRWAENFQYWNSANYARAWSSDAPRTTPDGFADPAAAVKALEITAQEIKDKFGRLDTPWGDTYRIKYGGIELPGNGATGGLGVFRVAWPAYSDEGISYIGGGDSWQGIIEFGEKVRAKVLLSYGNSSQPDSPHFGDQLPLFSEKKFRDARLYREEVVPHVVRREVRSKDGFSQKE